MLHFFRRMIATLASVGICNMNMASSIGTILGNACPVCGEHLVGHRYKVFAAISADKKNEFLSLLRDHNLRPEQLIDYRDEVHDPQIDILWYAVLYCSNNFQHRIIQHFSGAGIEGDESYDTLDAISSNNVNTCDLAGYEMIYFN